MSYTSLTHTTVSHLPFNEGIPTHYPPYSTVIGFLCNVLGIANQTGSEEPKDKYFQKLKEIKMSISGSFESKTTEYTWFRNLREERHTERFGARKIREINGRAEHFGGQVPVLIDILNEVHLVIHLSHNDFNLLKDFEEAIANPEKRLYPIHLGRAEDWVVIEGLKLCTLIEERNYGAYRRFFWIPKDEYPEVEGLIYRIPTFYKLSNGRREFEFVTAYLNDGKFKGVKCLFDREAEQPVFFARLSGYRERS